MNPYDVKYMRRHIKSIEEKIDGIYKLLNKVLDNQEMDTAKATSTKKED